MWGYGTYEEATVARLSTGLVRRSKNAPDRRKKMRGERREDHILGSTDCKGLRLVVIGINLPSYAFRAKREP